MGRLTRKGSPHLKAVAQLTPYSMRVSIWSHLANPAIDPPDYRRSKSYAAGLLAAGRAIETTRGLQLVPPPASDYDPGHGPQQPGFRDVWAIRPSGGHIFVWQMRTAR